MPAVTRDPGATATASREDSLRGLADQLRIYAPRRLLYGLPSARHLGRYLSARRAFDRAGPEPRWLPDEVLPRLQKECRAPVGYGYEADEVARRARLTHDRLVHLIPRLARRRIRTTLELGAYDAMTSAVLAARGCEAVALDLDADHVDPRARAAGVRFERMNAESLAFDTGSIDLVFSYNAFEHFEHPDRVLEESLRVVRPGGFVYLCFGPLYYSPWGLHEYQAFTVPYCHLLFPEEVLRRFARDHDLGPLDFDDVNRWPVDRYRALWRRVAPRARILRYYERRVLAHLDLVTAHPSCFRSKTTRFDDLTVAHVEVLFRRR